MSLKPRSDSRKPPAEEKPKVFIEHSTPNNQQAKILTYVASGLLLIMTLAFLWQQSVRQPNEPDNAVAPSQLKRLEKYSDSARKPSPTVTKGEPDFGPYIAELQRQIRHNWQPPRMDRNKRVVVLFKISRDGSLMNLRIDQSSGSEVADEAALAAVRASAPFQPLPKGYVKNDVDVQFIFDYETMPNSER